MTLKWFALCLLKNIKILHDKHLVVALDSNHLEGYIISFLITIVNCEACNSTTINLSLALPSSISWKILLDGSVVWKSQKPKVNRGGCLDFWRLLTPFTGLFWKLFEGRNITKLKLDITSKAKLDTLYCILMFIFLVQLHLSITVFSECFIFLYWFLKET